MPEDTSGYVDNRFQHQQQQREHVHRHHHHVHGFKRLVRFICNHFCFWPKSFPPSTTMFLGAPIVHYIEGRLYWLLGKTISHH